ncbi:MAG: hypothetical protein AUH84_07215 [Thaumarchaeota archaeon 13_1_40CM_4_38_7]|nr:MAG: hypothetical protein AUH84_07215 [Thaumarchaeota archaeon 13_1_40CM_4_38_7]OLC92488.1 MAG: hypothetical protein AUI92_05030 [Thaumarchaeota archaeon 13_1_40CM_3_38_6]OLD41499.1 MAG: hypothetical protein AUI60_01430 [Thaumarchaeota archaeon 13_1_40CM_2_39_4]
MSQNSEKRKMIETLIDPNVSVIIAELENGEKDSIYLTKKLRLSLDEIKARLSYVIEHGFVMMNQNDDKTLFRADMDKLNKIMESDENFTDVVDGLTELDQYLN